MEPKTYEEYLAKIKSVDIYLFQVPTEFITEEMCLAGIKASPSEFVSVPCGLKQKLLPELVKIDPIEALSHYPYGGQPAEVILESLNYKSDSDYRVIGELAESIDAMSLKKLLKELLELRARFADLHAAANLWMGK